MQIKALDHVQLTMPASEEARARSFYEGVLGIPEVSKPTHLAARGRAWFECGTLKVHFGVERDFAPARKVHPAFLVEGLQTLIETLRASGFDPASDTPLDGYDRVYVDAPFGNRLEFIEPTP